MKHIIGLLLLLSIFSCRKEEPLRGEELCQQIKEIGSPYNNKHKIDSIIRLSEKLSPAEHYTAIIRAAQAFSFYNDDSTAAFYLKRLDSLPFPRIDNKASGFLLLEPYAFGYMSPELSADSKALSALLFNMENRQRLTPEERCRFLTLKAGIFRNIFQEYGSAATLIS